MPTICRILTPLMVLYLTAGATAQTLPATQLSLGMNVADVAARIASKDWDTYSKAIAEAARLVEAERATQAESLLPLVPALFDRSGYGGIGEGL